MKRLFISLLLSLLGLAWANAQYLFERNSWGDYEDLPEAATALTTMPATGDVSAYVVDAATAVECESGSMEKATLAGIQIGFDFQFYGETFDKFAVAGNGYIVLGKKEAANIEFLKNKALLTMPLLDYCIGISSDIPVYDRVVAYQVAGEAGQQVLTVQFTGKYAKKLTEGQETATMVTYTYQVKLYEDGNRIEMVFDEGGRIMPAEFTGTIFHVGLKGSGTTCFFANASWNLNNTSDCYTDLMKTTDQVPQAGNGLTFKFEIGQPCAMPTYTVSDIILSPKSDEMGLTVVVDTAGKQALGYVVVASEQPIEGAPESGMNYSRGNALLGGTVVCAGTINSDWGGTRRDPKPITRWEFSHPYYGYETRLTPNTTYYYAVYFSNTGKCLTTYSEGTMKNGKTATTAPDSLKITSATMSEVTFSATANDLGEEIAILMTSQKREKNSNLVYLGNFAQIPADAEVGDKFETSYTRSGTTYVDSTVVLYKGPAKAGITCPVELKGNKMYYFGAVSKGAENGLYSSLTSDAEPYLTPASLPLIENFKDISFAEDEPFIGGWKGTTNFGINGSNTGTKSTMEKGPDQAVLVIPALDFPTDSNVLVNIAYSLDPYGYNADKVEGDSIMLEISTDGGETFKVLKAVHKNTDNLILGKVILSDYLGAQQAILRLRAVNANPDKAWNIIVTQVSISALPFCPEPGKPYVSATYGGTLGLTWYLGENNETQWNISTAPMAAEDEEPVWSRALVVNERPYYLTGLADREIYNVRVQAICGVHVSGWVESKVQAGRVPTFTEDFNNLPVESGYYGPELAWPGLWKIGYYYPGYSATSDEFPEKLQASSISSSYVHMWEYKTMESITEESENYNGSVGIDMDCVDYDSYYSGSHTYGKVIATPVIELNAAEQPKLVFDMAYGRMVDDELTAVTGDDIKVDHKVMLWASADSGRTFNTTAPIQTWDGTALAAMSAGQTITVDLSAYEGIRAFALGIQPTLNEDGGEEYLLWIDNIGIINEKPLARSVKVVSLSAEEATISWVADPTVEKWLVKLTGGNLTEPRFFEATGNTQTFDGLVAEKTYTASVAHLYTANDKTDTTAWVSVTFNTPALDCDAPTALAISDISRKSAKLTWQGNAADGYRVRYRPAPQEGATPMDWLEVEVAGTSCILNNLALETEYECGVQSVCNKIGQQESEYVAFDNFTTLALTCFAPTELRIDDLNAKAVKVSWTGTSDKYQVAWMSQISGSAWAYSDIITGDAYTIRGLDYYSFYTFKVRGVCAAGDSSEWSETRNFRTLPRPACPDPTNLRVEGLTQTSATLLWDAEAEEEGDIQNYMLRHRLASVQAWDSIKDIKANSYAITDMMPKTAYIWAVMTGCLDDRYSENWAQLRFETLEDLAVEDLKDQAGLYVATAQGQVYIMNPQSVQIDNIRIYATTGRRLEQYAIRSNDNVILTTKVRNNVVIVEIESAGRFFRFKTLLP